MLVELARVLNVKHLIRINLVGVSLNRTDGYGVALPFFLEHGENLPLIGRAGRGTRDYVLNLELFYRQ